MLIKKINKLFYGKYPYRIETKTRGAGLLVRRGYDYINDFCNSNRVEFSSAYQWRGEKFTRDDKNNLQDYINVAHHYILNDAGHDIKVRAEGSKIQFYVADYVLYNEMQRNMFRFIREINEPNSQEELDFMLSNGAKKCLVDELPHGTYEYKVTLASNITVSKRASFINWLCRYPEEKVKLTKETSRWLRNERRWMYQPFLYVKDAPMLSMLGMYISGHVQRVDQYIVRSSITTE